VAVDGREREGLASALLDLAADPVARQSLGTRAQAYTREYHSIEMSVGGYIGFINQVLGNEVLAR
jgi:hypothetical protein